MSKHRIMTSALVVALTFAIASPVFVFAAPGRGMGPGMGNGIGNGSGKVAGGGFGSMGMGKGLFLRGLVGDLELTDDQRTQIEGIVTEYRERMMNLAEELTAAGIGLSAVMHADVPDEAAIRQATREISAVQEEMNVIRATVMARVKQVLTEEQRALIDEWEAQKMEKIQARLESMGTRIDEWLESSAD